MSLWSRRTCPVTRADGTRSCIRFRLRSTVDLPQPEGPMMAVTLLAGKSMETAFTAWVVPKWTFRLARRIFVDMEVPRLHMLLPAKVASRQVQGKHDPDQDQRPGPGQAVPVVVGGDGEVEYLQRQGRHRFRQFPAPELVPQGGEEERRRLPGDAGNGEEDAGDDAGAGAGEGNLQ